MFRRGPRQSRVAQQWSEYMSAEHSPVRAEDAPGGRLKAERAKQAPPTVDRIVGEIECRQLTDLSRTSRWRLMRRGQFPKKIRLSANRTGWHLSSILAWLDEREPVS